MGFVVAEKEASAKSLFLLPEEKQTILMKPRAFLRSFLCAVSMNLVNIPFSPWTKHVRFHPSPQELPLGNSVYSLLPEVTVLLRRADGKLPFSSIITGKKAYGNEPELHWGFQMLTEKKQTFFTAPKYLLKTCENSLYAGRSYFLSVE